MSIGAALVAKLYKKTDETLNLVTKRPTQFLPPVEVPPGRGGLPIGFCSDGTGPSIFHVVLVYESPLFNVSCEMGNCQVTDKVKR